MNQAPAPKLVVRYGAGQALVIAAFLFVPTDSWWHCLWQVVVGWSAVACLVVPVHRRRSPSAKAWYAFGAGVFLNATGILVAELTKSFHPDWTDNGLADLFWLALFPGLAAGMAVLVRRRTVEKDWTALVDAAILTTSLGLLSWVFIIRPAAIGSHLSNFARAEAIAYPVGDVAIAGMMARLVLGGGKRNAAFRLMVMAVLMFLLVDVGWALINHFGWIVGPLLQHLLEMGSMSAYALFGASALHPSSEAIAEKIVKRRQSVSPALLVSLMAAALVAPAVLWVKVLRHDVADGVAIALCATVMFVLVVLRMTQLVRRVEERTRELAERNRAVRLVLDTVREGLLRVAPDGTLMLECSAAAESWFGSFDEPLPFVDYIRRVDPVFAVAFQVGYEAYLDDFLPADLCLAQLPKRLRTSGREYRATYLPVADGAKQDGLLVCMEDVTDEVLRARQDAEQAELLAMFQLLTRDRAWFVSFFEEASRVLEQLSSTQLERVEQGRLLHTLKGNASMIALNLVAQLCDEAENRLEEQDGLQEAIEGLKRRWVTLSDELKVLVGAQSMGTISVSAKEVEHLRSEINRGLSAAQILETIDGWQNEPAERPLNRLALYAHMLARRLGKGEVAIAVEGNGFKFDPQRWSPLWSELVHVIGNAVDHGYDSSDERMARRKPPQLHLRLGVARTEGGWSLEIEDDGAGIDWEAVRRSAIRRGLTAETQQDLLHALLTSGVTTRDTVTMISGRGVGMSAVAARVEQLGGTIQLQSQPGEGTCWRFCFPLSSMARPPMTAEGGRRRSRPPGVAAA